MPTFESKRSPRRRATKENVPPPTQLDRPVGRYGGYALARAPVSCEETVPLWTLCPGPSWVKRAGWFVFLPPPALGHEPWPHLALERRAGPSAEPRRDLNACRWHRSLCLANQEGVEGVAERDKGRGVDRARGLIPRGTGSSENHPRRTGRGRGSLSQLLKRARSDERPQNKKVPHHTA